MNWKLDFSPEMSDMMAVGVFVSVLQQRKHAMRCCRFGLKFCAAGVACQEMPEAGRPLPLPGNANLTTTTSHKCTRRPNIHLS